MGGRGGFIRQVEGLRIEFGSESDRFIALDGERPEIETIADREILEIDNVFHAHPSPLATDAFLGLLSVYVNVRRC